MRYPLIAVLFVLPLWSVNYVVNVGTDASVSSGGSGSGTTGELRYVLNQILNNQAQGLDGSDIIAVTFTVGSVTLSNHLPPINLFDTYNTITIGNSSGSPVSINGGGTFSGEITSGGYRPFFIRQGNVTLQNLDITNCTAQGGNGSEGGGGGMGAGAAVFIDTATVNFNNVTFSSNSAIAGRGAALFSGIGGGGGGLGGNGGNNLGGGGGIVGSGGGK